LRKALLAVLLLGFLALPALAGAKEEYLEAVQAIRCDCGCHPQSLNDCACGYAENLREEIAGMIEAPDGSIRMTGAAVIAKFIAEKGEQILISPKASGFNLLAWLGPLIGLGLALFTALFLIRTLGRRSARDNPLPAGGVPAPPPEAGDDAYHDKLRRQLKEWD
jgi:cytochrome c-type biogenesis protein CcmH/NrfF